MNNDTTDKSSLENCPHDESVNNNQPDETAAIVRITEESKEIIAPNELIEKTKRDIILSIITKQEKILKVKEEEFDKLVIELGLIDKKRRIAKKALKKAKELKLDSDKIAMIKLDARQTKEQRKTCKCLVKQGRADITKLKALIGLLDNII